MLPRALIAIAAVLLFLAMIDGWSWLAFPCTQYSPAIIAKEQQANYYERYHACPYRGGFVAGKFAAVSGWQAQEWTAAATLLLAFGTLVVAATGHRQIELVRKDFIATHRPKIAVHTITRFLANPGRVADEPPTIGSAWIGGHLHYVNAGSVPAHIIRVEATIFHAQLAVPGKHSIEVWSPEKNVLAGGEDDTCAIYSQIAERTLSDQNPLFVQGRIIYADDNGVRRETGFCRKYDMLREHWTRMDDPELEYAD